MHLAPLPRTHTPIHVHPHPPARVGTPPCAAPSARAASNSSCPRTSSARAPHRPSTVRRCCLLPEAQLVSRRAAPSCIVLACGGSGQTAACPPRCRNSLTHRGPCCAVQSPMTAATVPPTTSAWAMGEPCRTAAGIRPAPPPGSTDPPPAQPSAPLPRCLAPHSRLVPPAAHPTRCSPRPRPPACAQQVLLRRRRVRVHRRLLLHRLCGRQEPVHQGPPRAHLLRLGRLLLRHCQVRGWDEVVGHGSGWLLGLVRMSGHGRAPEACSTLP